MAFQPRGRKLRCEYKDKEGKQCTEAYSFFKLIPNKRNGAEQILEDVQEELDGPVTKRARVARFCYDCEVKARLEDWAQNFFMLLNMVCFLWFLVVVIFLLKS